MRLRDPARLETLLALLTAPQLAGCGSERERNINRDRDRPRSGEKEKEKEKGALPFPSRRALAQGSFSDGSSPRW